MTINEIYLAVGRLRNVQVQVGHMIDPSKAIDPKFIKCAQSDKPFQKGETRNLICDSPVIGRFVKLVLLGNSEILTVCEVQVYGDQGKGLCVKSRSVWNEVWNCM